jgi:hypothetical protein
MRGDTPPWRGAQLKHRDNLTFTLKATEKEYKYKCEETRQQNDAPFRLL